MPISKQDKEKTRAKMLDSACKLFMTKGYGAVTVDQVMKDSKLTRGAFYGHFTSKAHIYSEAIKFAISNSKFVKTAEDAACEHTWLAGLLDGYLSIEHVNGTNPCPLAFLATDIVGRDEAARSAYSQAYDNVNKVVLNYAQKHTACSKKEVLSLTAMIIGTVAISRTINDSDTVKDLLAACRSDAGLKLGGI